MQRYLLLILGYAFSFLLASGQKDWELKLDKEGIKIFTSPFYNSKIKALKVECTLEASLSQVAAVLLDTKRQDQWLYHTKSSLLLQVSPAEFYCYVLVNLPWPCSNRDFIEHIQMFQDPQTKVITMEVNNVPDFVPTKGGIVRVTQSFCKWLVKTAGNNLVKIEFIFFADPGGSIPSWLINLYSSLGPFETFKKLKAQLKKPDYRDAYFPFIND